MDKPERVGIKKIPIKDIIVGDRYRKDMADLQTLGLSLQIEGQLLPLVVDIAEGGKYRLVEGERRIRAAKLVGIKELECIMWSTLTDLRRKELELVMCVQRQQLHYMEEARAVKDLVDRRKKEGMVGGIAKFGKTVRNKDIATELNMTPARMSEDLRIATALEERPDLEASTFTRTEFLRKVRNREFEVPDEGHFQSVFKQNFIVTTPVGCLETVNDKIIDLCIMHPDKVDPALLQEVIAKLKITGQLIIFATHKDCYEWEKLLTNNGFNTGPQPYIWHIKDAGDYQNYIWSSPNLLGPLRPMQNMLSASRPNKSFHNKGKPMQLISNIIKCCTERGAFVVIPECHDIESVRCCVESDRNVRAAVNNKIERDRLILSATKVD